MRKREWETICRLHYNDACNANKWKICYSLYIVNTTGKRPLEKSYLPKTERWVSSTMKRFWDKVQKTETCWLWLASKDKDGYGRIKMNGRPKPAHRVVWELSFGIIPQGLQVLHMCDNTSCVNPSHLFLGNNDDNVADKVSKRRQSKHETHGRSKLSGENVIIIRFLRKYHRKEFTLKQIGAYFGISITHGHQLERNLRWN